MADILLNGLSFHESWGGSALQYLIRPDAKVVILPLSGNDGYSSDARQWEACFTRGRKQYEALVRPFRSFGIHDDQISMINYYSDDEDSASRKIGSADIVYLVGRNPVWMMQRLEDLHITDLISSFGGTLIGNAAGAMIMMENFTAYHDGIRRYEKGLARQGGFRLDLTFDQTEQGIYRLIHLLETEDTPVVVLSGRCGAVIDGTHFDLLGDGMLLGPEDLDMLYDTVKGSEHLG